MFVDQDSWVHIQQVIFHPTSILHFDISIQYIELIAFFTFYNQTYKKGQNMIKKKEVQKENQKIAIKTHFLFFFLLLLLLLLMDTSLALLNVKWCDLFS